MEIFTCSLCFWGIYFVISSEAAKGTQMSSQNEVKVLSLWLITVCYQVLLCMPFIY